jgi:transcriptional regulator with XRE-family HTH domain/mannose-6-phosphate isomerase-like protein (cupin superfamily)
MSEEGPAGNDPADVGRQIAATRRVRQMKMVDLSRAAGVSPSMISQIERGHALPSVSTLYAIAEALDVTVHSLFASEPATAAPEVERPPADGGVPDAGAPETTVLERLGRGRLFDWAGPTSQGPVLRRSERQFSEMAGGVRWERLTPVDLPDADIIATLYRPGAASSEKLYRHQGREMHLVTEGRIVVELAFQRYELGIGDSITFDSTEPHRYSNPFEEPAHGVTVLLPQYRDRTVPPSTP